MNRFLTSATAMALGLALCGNADASRDPRFDHEGLGRDHSADCDGVFQRCRFPSEWDGMPYFEHWWLDFDPYDLRYFEDRRVHHDGFHGWTSAT